ncbi:MAG: hypothetical protein ACFB9M_15455 [Myxococcota bacterium]
MKLYICTGKHCRKRLKEVEAALSAVRDEIEVCRVGCQKICDGPVFGVQSESSLEWFRSVDSIKSRDALVQLIQTGETKKPLRKRRVKDRRDRLRG